MGRYREEIERTNKRIDIIDQKKTKLDWETYYMKMELDALKEQVAIMERIEEDLARLESIRRR